MINEKLIRELASLNFLEEAKNILSVGAPGVGKTHLAISVGIKAIQERKRVVFLLPKNSLCNLPLLKYPVILTEHLIVFLELI
jgi:DNA replication protein DnaC